MILAIDQGTTGTTALLVNAQAEVVATGRAPVTQYYPKPGWVEHDPEQIWSSVRRAVATALTAAGDPAVAAIGVANQRETSLAWSARTGSALAPAIVWQCRRTAQRCEELRAGAIDRQVRRRTGLVLDPYFSATKFEWLLDNVPAVDEARRSGDLRLGTVDAWLVWRLSGGAHISDATNAARTLLLDIDTGAWSDELAGRFHVPVEALPEVVDSSGPLAATGDQSPVARGVPICGLAGDQQAALFGHLATTAGELKSTYGTGCFLLQHAGHARPADRPGLLTTIATRLDGKLAYALEGSVFVGGALIQWLRDGLGLIATAAESEKLARQVPDAAGVVIVPAFAGLGAPYWDPRARGAIVGLTRGVTRAHLCRAALEAIAHQVADVAELMPPSTAPLRVDGGAAVNDLLMQLQAAILGRTVHRPAQLETTALGAAYLAGLGCGFWSSVDEIRSLRPAEQVFDPGSPHAITSRDTWRRAIERAKAWEDEGPP